MQRNDPGPGDDRILLSARRRRTRAYAETMLFLALSIIVAAVAVRFDLFEQLVSLTREFENYELDEIFAGLITTSLVAIAFCGRRLADLAQSIEEVEIIDSRRSQDCYRLGDAIEAIDAGFALWDGDDRLVLCNERYRIMFPEGADALVPGARFADVLAVYYRRLSAVCPDQPLAAQLEARLAAHRAGGSAIFLDPLGRWIRADERRTWDGGTVSLRTDITVMKQREMDLERAAVHAEHQAQDLGTLADQLGDALRTAQALRLEAEAANVAKSNFLATMSHELRTPLNAIIGFSEIIKNRSFGENWIEKYYSYAADINSSGVHLLNIINQILDLSKIESGNVELKVRHLDFPELLEDCCDLVRHEARTKRLRLQSDIEEGGRRIWADERSLKQILFNILSNAIKYTVDGGEIRVASRALGNGGVEVSVSDTGIGIPKKEISRLLRPFERMDTGYTSSAGGSGLGLAIVHSLMEAHGGSVRIDSEPGHGTSVILAFPRPAADRHGSGGARRSPGLAADRGHAARAETVRGRIGVRGGAGELRRSRDPLLPRQRRRHRQQVLEPRSLNGDVGVHGVGGAVGVAGGDGRHDILMLVVGVVHPVGDAELQPPIRL